MKKILLATTILAASAGFASAEVTLSGDARMGLINDFGAGDTTIFTSRARVKFTMSGETDGGLSFGASFRANDAVAAKYGTAGSVYISGAFGKISMGDVDGAALSAVGQVSGVGLTSLNTYNELTHIGNGGTTVTGATSDDPSLLYEYSAGDLTAYVGITNPSSASNTSYGVGVKYAMGAYTVGLGYEVSDLVGSSVNEISLGGSATFGAATVKAVFMQTDFGAASKAQTYALSVDYAINAAKITAFYANAEETSGIKAYGLGGSYDLGGGASVVGGYVHDQTNDLDAFDLGVAMSF